jgi:hypothetical protein
MGSYLTGGAYTPGTSGAVSIVGPLPTVVAGDRVYVLVSSGAANPNTLTSAPALSGTSWVKCDEWAPDGTFKSALFYADITAGNAAAWSGSSHTWTWQTSSRAAAEWLVYRDVDQSRPPLFAKASAVADTVAPSSVPAVTPGTYDWCCFGVLGRQSPGTDTAKTWVLSGFSTDAERVDQYATNTGTGQKLSVAGYDTDRASSLSVPTGGGGGGTGAQTITLTDARPVNTWNSIALNAPSTVRIGATLDRTALDIWKPRLIKNGWMRIFPDEDKLPPDWGDNRFKYCEATKAHPFISTKIEGDTAKLQLLYNWLEQMPVAAPWIYNDPTMLLWFVEHHEPEKEYVKKYGSNAAGAAKYIENYKLVWNKLATLPAGIRAKIRMGPALTKQWTEVSGKGNFDYGPFDPGVSFRQFKGYDSYVDSGSLSTSGSSYPNPATWLQYIKADDAGGQIKIQIEFGAINKVGDDTGSGRAEFLQGCHDEMMTWPDYGGLIWWNDHGTPSDTSIANIGKERYFELDLRYASADVSTDLPKVTTTITYGSGGGGGSAARAITPSLAQANAHLWSFSVPMVTPAPPAVANVWSTMGLPIK